MATRARPSTAAHVAAHELVTLEMQRRLLTQKLDKIEKRQLELKAALVAPFTKTKLTEIEDRHFRVFAQKQPTATIQDWRSVLYFAWEHPEAGVVHKRLSPTAIEALAMADTLVPGAVLDHHYVVQVKPIKEKKS